MLFNKKILDNHVVIHILNKELSMFTAKSLKYIILNQIEEEKKDIVINMTNVTHLDGTGLCTMLNIHKICIDNNLVLKICCINADIEMVLFLTGIDKHLNIYMNEKQACERDQLNKLAK